MTTTELRCPECGSLVRAGMTWCTLCHADLRSDEEKEAARLEAERLAGAGVTLPSDLVLPASELATSAAPPRGRHARPSAAPAVRLPVTASVAGSVDVAESDAGTPTALAEAGPMSSADTDHKLAELREAGIDVDGMLAVLSATSSADPLNGIADRLSSKGSRAIAVIIASTALTALIFGLMFILGSVFG